jgi:hypothetical protein
MSPVHWVLAYASCLLRVRLNAGDTHARQDQYRIKRHYALLNAALARAPNSHIVIFAVAGKKIPSADTRLIQTYVHGGCS